MTDNLTVVVQRRVPSQNSTQYRHWRAYAKERDLWFVLLRRALVPKPRERRRVSLVIRSYRTRLCDAANLVGGAKPIPDALIRLGYLYDDSPQWMQCAYEQHRVPAAEERTEIEFVSVGRDRTTVSSGVDPAP